MLRNLKQYFDRHILPAGQGESENAQHALRVATAALLFEVMRTDGELKAVERDALTATIRKNFDLTSEETAQLMGLAKAEAEESADYYQFTTLINEHYTPEQKEKVVENLWQIAFADHEIDRFERTLVHKIADLLYVPRAAQIAARERALRSGT
jgi:uncharacterized tellurite resistance protein B-like protein